MAVTNEELKTAHKIVRRVSNIEAFDKSGVVFKGYQIWTNISPTIEEDPNVMFVKCVVQHGSNQDKLNVVQIDPPGNGTPYEIDIKNAWNCNSQVDPMSFGDIGLLNHTNTPCVLDFLKHRYLKNQIYTTACPLIVAINPYKDLGNTTDEWIRKYRDASDHTRLPPHIFSCAREALSNLHGVNKSQTIIVSGESGAGKTEATKQIMKYFASSKNGNMDLYIQTAIMAANPVLEAFGNAKTIRNNNSSRFGRFMQLAISHEGGIRNGSVVAFLLEKSRIITQDDNERSYHIFYQFLKGADKNMKAKFGLKGIKDYKLLNPNSPDVDGIDDVKDFQEVVASLKNMQLNDEQIEVIFSIIAGILTLGNVRIIEKTEAGLSDAAGIHNDDMEIFRKACELMFLDPESVKRELLIKVTIAGGNRIEGRWNKNDAEVLKLSLCKAMYEKLFLWIIKNLNSRIEPEGGFKAFMGMLDIFGFEVFKNNSLEQLFINITNEMLQKNFVDIVFERESKLYRDEGISTAELNYTSNKEVISVLCERGKSVLSYLEDQCLAPGGSDEKFVNACVVNLKSNEKFIPAKVASNKNFIIQHTIGPIQYCSDNFLLKNKDVLRGELVEIILGSENKVVSGLFEGQVIEKGKMAKGSLIGSQFLNQLTSLMTLINSTEPHFIRCIKPNENKKPLEWCEPKILIQLHALSILEALVLRQLGYSYRRTFDEFLYQFKFVDINTSENSALDSREKCNQILKISGLSDDMLKIGKTMVFLKQDGAKMLSKMQREKLVEWENCVSVIEAAIMKYKHKQNVENNVSSLMRVQAHIRKRMVA
ncbi:myosin A [Plasmodium berghei]|uniref:Myosin-A n=3 Tax=Plasmodium berghei TaxID=5821 RepID=A0A509ATE8_PLABA|nr:myosin A [Plasmodium berghei ANKA]AAG24559.1 myosin A [Plasmodium berghei]CXJ03190.1 myosin A [Plasmodium berghei]SCL98435.1 myosin A [Plasmodium berghei]SCM16830.1 myosin A [Plasmodium berghei]SCM18628.1 myosin A [Plasmodium berghei]|eukprot:XP_034423714.1 myosin A [Plasmodium berghei ANKA]